MQNRSIRSSSFRQAAGLVLMVTSLLAGGTAAFAQPIASDREVTGHDWLRRERPLHAAISRGAGRLTYGSGLDPQTVTKSGSNWFVRHPVLTGTLVGTGVGLTLSQVDSIGSLNHDPRVGLIGAAVGAWSGLIASASQKARAGQKVSVGTKIGIAAGAVSLIVLPIAACYGAGGCGGSS